LLSAIFALLLLAPASSAGGGGPSADSLQPVIGGPTQGIASTTLTAQGTASRSASYDGAVARFSVRVLRDSIIAAVSDGNAAVAGIAAAVEARCTPAAMSAADGSTTDACVSPQGLQTLGIRIEEEFDYTDQGRMSEGFLYENSLSIAIVGTQFAGGLVDLVIGAGGDLVRFEGLGFTTSQRAEIERLALLDAIDSARLTARSIADHMGYELVRIIEINPRESFQFEFDSGRGGAVPAAAPAPTMVFAGQAVITSRVSLVFELRPR
jgi:uncharacterized protein YggE